MHSKDIAMVKTQLSITASDSKEEKSVCEKSSILKEGMEKSDNLCPGAKRSFLCRMKKAAKAENLLTTGAKTSIKRTKANVMVDDRDTVLSKIFIPLFIDKMYAWSPH